jgi:hypothetical protein
MAIPWYCVHTYSVPLLQDQLEPEIVRVSRHQYHQTSQTHWCFSTCLQYLSLSHPFLLDSYWISAICQKTTQFLIEIQKVTCKLTKINYIKLTEASLLWVVVLCRVCRLWGVVMCRCRHSWVLVWWGWWGVVGPHCRRGGGGGPLPGVWCWVVVAAGGGWWVVSAVRCRQYFSLPHLFLPDSRTPVGFLLDSYWTPGLQLDSYWIPTGLLDSSWIPTGFLLDFQSNRSPVGILESSRSPTGLLLDFNHFSGKNLIATELQYKTVIVN